MRLRKPEGAAQLSEANSVQVASPISIRRRADRPHGRGVWVRARAWQQARAKHHAPGLGGDSEHQAKGTRATIVGMQMFTSAGLPKTTKAGVERRKVKVGASNPYGC